jgi:predicted Zn-dependent protease
MRVIVTGLSVVGALAVPGAAIFFATLGLEPEKASSSRREVAPVATGSMMREVPSPVDGKLYAAANAALDHPDDAKLETEYALMLEQKAREVGNAAYHQMAGKAARKALAKDPNNGLAKTALGVALLGEHRFADALAFVRSVEGKMIWKDACEYDALYELGDYDAALAKVQELVDFKPGSESYPRVAQARDLVGDAAGAMEMWKLDIFALPEKTQARAWAESQAGDLEMRHGDLAAAEAAYRASLVDYPEYYMPRIGLARCEVARGNLEAAEGILTPMMAAHGDVPTAALLGDIETALGKKELAAETWQRALQAEELSTLGGISDRRSLAVFLADHGRDLEKAVSVARAELATRATVANEDALAWALLASGDTKEAAKHMTLARRLGTKTPWVLYHAGAIELALGNRQTGTKLLLEALASGLKVDLVAAKRAEALIAGG